MPVSKPQSKPSLDKAKVVLREQWPEVIQYLGDRANRSKTVFSLLNLNQLSRSNLILNFK